MSRYIFLVLTIAGMALAGNPTTYNVKEINSTAGLFYDYLYNLKFSTSAWKLITYIELDHFINQRPILSDHTLLIIKEIFMGCLTDHEKGNPAKCDQFLQMASSIKLKLKFSDNYIYQLKSISTQPEQETEIRRKRDLINDKNNLIGKSFFTSLSEDECIEYNGKIDEMIASRKKYISDFQNRTHILPAEVARMHKLMDNASHYYLTSRALIESHYQKFAEAPSKGRNYWESHYALITCLHYMENYIDTYNHILKLIIDAVNLSKVNVLHPEILSSQRLESSMQFFIKYNDDLKFPMSIQDAISGHLAKISQISLGYHRGRLFIMLKSPLTEERIYHLHRLRPYPIQQILGNNTIGSAYIEPRAKYLILSHDQTEYTLIKNKNELPFCQSTYDIHVCEALDYPLYETSHQPNCEISLITKTNESPLTNCDIKISRHFNPYWRKVSNERGWLFSLPSRQEVHIICEEAKNTIEIEGVGILKIRAGCRAVTSYATILGQQTIDAEEGYEYKTTVSLNVTKILPEIINFTIMETNYSLPNPAVLSYDMSLHQIQQEIINEKEKKLEKIRNRKTIIGIILIEIVLGLVLSIIILSIPVIYIFKKIISFFKSKNCDIQDKIERSPKIPTSTSIY